MLSPNRHLVALIALAVLPLLTGCMNRSADSDRGATASAAALTDLSSPLALPSGVQMAVRLDSGLSSETVRTGDPWSGTIVTGVTVGNSEVIPAGSTVRGIVTGAQPATRGTRAMLDLVIQDVAVGAESRPLTAGIEAILAELPARRLGEAVAVEKGSEVVLVSGSELVFVVQDYVAMR